MMLVIHSFATRSLVYDKRTLFNKEILALMLIPLFSAIPANIFHQQSYVHSILAAKHYLLFLFYFYLKTKRIDFESIEKLIVGLGVVVAIIYIVQTVTFPITFFQVIKDTNDVAFEVRANVVRILFFEPTYMVFALLYYGNKLVKERNIKNIVFLGICVTGVMLTATRQIIFFSIGSLMMLYLLTLNFRSVRTYSFLILFVVIAAVFVGVGGGKYLDSLINLTQRQDVTGADYVRLRAFNFYLYDYMPSIVNYIIGNGVNYGDSAYGKEMLDLEQGQGLYRSDIGLVGALNLFGIIYILPIFFIFLKVFRAKLHNRTYYKFFFFYILTTAFTGGNLFSLPWTFTLIFMLLYNVEKIVGLKNDSRVFGKKALSPVINHQGA
ncbi:hypothetical protein [Mucilaginibacter myungsuensis]|uniref:Uncharacterized protein n=1 Tax=Mucilaginibacter myungsuensis TaxID=649104 RepID=A0A929KXS7_9SPHI|nr:hypothetical protein [Mucilaginibacter myungsuensis]MBE9662413.1 hypothetical protein [Mucilaginibacter myungsuensis]